jgi:hypothetical protein
MKKLTKQERFEIIDNALALEFLTRRQLITFIINLTECKLDKKQKG